MSIHTEVNVKELSEFFKVFCDETRLRILDTLIDKEKCVSDISLEVGMSPSCVSHQLKNLRSLNLVKTSKNGQSVSYSISDEHIKIILKYGIEHIKERKDNDIFR